MLQTNPAQMRVVDTSKIYPMPTKTERPFVFHPSQMKLDIAGQEIRKWVLYLKEGETFEQAQDASAYRTIMGGHVFPRCPDFLTVFNYDKTRFIELHVIAADRTRLKTELIRESKRPEVEVPEGAKLSVKWNVGKQRHEVVRGEGPEKIVLAGDFQLKEDAVAWLIDHEKKMNS